MTQDIILKLIVRATESDFDSLVRIIENHVKLNPVFFITKGGSKHILIAGDNPLMAAIRNKNIGPKIITLLLKLSPNTATTKIMVNQLDSYQQTFLYLALKSGSKEIINIANDLVEKGIIDLSVEMNELNILQLAVLLENETLVNQLLSMPAIKTILNVPSNEGMTPLCRASLKGNLKLVEMLLEVDGVNPFIPDNKGALPLDHARFFIYLEIISKLENAQDLFQKKHEKEYHEAIAFYNQLQMIIYTGHFLGIRTLIPIDNPYLKKKIHINTEGGSQLQAIGVLNKSLAIFIQNIENSRLKISAEQQTALLDLNGIKNAFSLSSNYFNTHNNNLLNQLISNCNSKDPPILTILLSGWKNHAVTIGVMGDLLFVTNRGMGIVETGSTIYRLKPGIKFNEEILNSLSKLSPEVSMEEVKANIAKLVDPNYRGLPLGSTKIMGGSCSMSNPKSHVEACLFAQQFYKLTAEKRQTLFDAMKLDSNKTEETAKKTALEAIENNPSFHLTATYAENLYKSFTSFIRNNEVQKLIDSYKTAIQNNDVPNIQLYRRIISEYLLAHHGAKRKMKLRGETPKPISELKRVEMIFKAFQGKELQKILEEVELLIKEKSQQGKKISFNLVEYALENNFYQILTFEALDLNKKEIREKYHYEIYHHINQLIKKRDLAELKNFEQSFPGLILEDINRESSNIEEIFKNNQGDIFNYLTKNVGLKLDTITNQSIDENETLLLIAARLNKIEQFKLLDLPELQKALNIPDVSGIVPLFYTLNDLELSQKLIDKGAKLNLLTQISDAMFKYNSTPLAKLNWFALSVLNNDMDSIKFLFNDPKINTILSEKINYKGEMLAISDFVKKYSKNNEILSILSKPEGIFLLQYQYQDNKTKIDTKLSSDAKTSITVEPDPKRPST